MSRPKPVHQMTAAQFDARFKTEDDCIAYLVVRRWPQGVVCPRCGNVKVYALSSGHHWQWQCYGCAQTAIASRSWSARSLKTRMLPCGLVSSHSQDAGQQEGHLRPPDLPGNGLRLLSYRLAHVPSHPGWIGGQGFSASSWALWKSMRRLWAARLRTAIGTSGAAVELLAALGRILSLAPSAGRAMSWPASSRTFAPILLKLSCMKPSRRTLACSAPINGWATSISDGISPRSC